MNTLPSTLAKSILGKRPTVNDAEFAVYPEKRMKNELNNESEDSRGSNFTGSYS
jgi:hypothetical protein